MAPESRDSHCAALPARCVLEVNRGWFTQRGIRAGDRLEGEPFSR